MDDIIVLSARLKDAAELEWSPAVAADMLAMVAELGARIAARS